VATTQIELKEIAKHYLSVAAGVFIGANIRLAFEPKLLTARNLLVAVVDYVVLFGVGLFFLWKSAKQGERQ